MWRRNRAGVKFRRQHPIRSYIPDFYCRTARLAIELDGGYHDEEEQAEYDYARTLSLEAGGARCGAE
jgi:very-short-patch-repair endonuclease